MVKYGKITGSMFEQQLSREFMISTLGIIGENEQTKLKTEVIRVQKAKVLEVQLYGWGSNILG